MIAADRKNLAAVQSTAATLRMKSAAHRSHGVTYALFCTWTLSYRLRVPAMPTPARLPSSLDTGPAEQTLVGFSYAMYWFSKTAHPSAFLCRRLPPPLRQRAPANEGGAQRGFRETFDCICLSLRSVGAQIVDVAANMPANTHTTAAGFFLNRIPQRLWSACVRSTCASSSQLPPCGLPPVRAQSGRLLPPCRFEPCLMAVCANCRISSQLLQHVSPLHCVVQARVPELVFLRAAIPSPVTVDAFYQAGWRPCKMPWKLFSPSSSSSSS